MQDLWNTLESWCVFRSDVSLGGLLLGVCSREPTNSQEAAAQTPVLLSHDTRRSAGWPESRCLDGLGDCWLLAANSRRCQHKTKHIGNAVRGYAAPFLLIEG